VTLLTTDREQRAVPDRPAGHRRDRRSTSTCSRTPTTGPPQSASSSSWRWPLPNRRRARRQPLLHGPLRRPPLPPEVLPRRRQRGAVRDAHDARPPAPDQHREREPARAPRGFATGMRFSGDTEMLRRAAHVARVVNVQQVLYFRRDRDGALTASQETGLQSPARLEVRKRLAERARRNAAGGSGGATPRPDAAVDGPSVELVHVVGPRLHGCPSAAEGGVMARRLLGRQRRSPTRPC
jgi:hypothetical protein